MGLRMRKFIANCVRYFVYIALFLYAIKQYIPNYIIDKLPQVCVEFLDKFNIDANSMSHFCVLFILYLFTLHFDNNKMRLVTESTETHIKNINTELSSICQLLSLPGAENNAPLRNPERFKKVISFSDEIFIIASSFRRISRTRAVFEEYTKGITKNCTIKMAFVGSGTDESRVIFNSAMPANEMTSDDYNDEIKNSVRELFGLEKELAKNGNKLELRVLNHPPIFSAVTGIKRPDQKGETNGINEIKIELYSYKTAADDRVNIIFSEKYNEYHYDFFLRKTKEMWDDAMSYDEWKNTRSN